MNSIKKIYIMFFIFLQCIILYAESGFYQTDFAIRFKALRNNEERYNVAISLIYSDIKVDSSFALLYLREAEQLAWRNNKKDKLFEIYLALSDMYLNYDNYDMCYINSIKALDHIRFVKDENLVYNNYKNLAISSYYRNEFDKSIESYKKCLEIAKKINNLEYLSDTLSKISIIQNQRGNVSEAIKFSWEALAIRKELGDYLNIILSYSNLGGYYTKISDYTLALENYLKALQIAEENQNERWIGTSKMNIGTIYHYLKEDDKALNFYLQALDQISESDPLTLSKLYNNIALSYKRLGEHQNSIDYHYKSLELNKKYNHVRSMATSYTNIGSIHSDMGNYDHAIEYLHKALPIYQKLNFKFGLCSIYNNLGAVYMRSNRLDQALEYAMIAYDLVHELGAKSQIITNYALIIKIYELMNDYQNAYENMIIYTTYRDSIFNQAKAKQISELQVTFDFEKKEKENALLRKDKEIQRLELNRLRIRWIILLIAVVCLSMFFIFIIILYVVQKKSNQKLQNASRTIENEKNKSEELLLNILPYNIAQEIKEKGSSNPQSFENVTIYFSDLVNFTQICSELNPIEVIKELNEIFSVFDMIFIKHSCEKIKTTGDAYLAVCGIPKADDSHAENIFKAANDILHYIYQRNQKSRVKWQIRIGIHTGKVVGGIIGEHKFIYDIFGDSINIASRLENLCTPMQVNISEVTYNLISHFCQLESSESLNVKGKGLMKIYTYIPNFDEQE